MGHIRVDPPNTNNKWVGFGLANVDTFIIRVGFGLANIDTFRTLTRHEHNPLTRIATPTFTPPGGSDKGILYHLIYFCYVQKIFPLLLNIQRTEVSCIVLK